MSKLINLLCIIFISVVVCAVGDIFGYKWGPLAGLCLGFPYMAYGMAWIDRICDE